MIVPSCKYSGLAARHWRLAWLALVPLTTLSPSTSIQHNWHPPRSLEQALRLHKVIAIPTTVHQQVLGVLQLSAHSTQSHLALLSCSSIASAVTTEHLSIDKFSPLLSRASLSAGLSSSHPPQTKPS